MEQRGNESVTQLLVRISLNYIQLNLVHDDIYDVGF